MYEEFYKGKRVLVTGHTGFKGSWLTRWLIQLGANVYGVALEASTKPAHSKLLDSEFENSILDIRNFEELERTVKVFQPEIVFHLAAQPLVRYSYSNPIETYETNVMGSLHLYQACRSIECLKSIVCVTTDKCYENREWIWGYRESDRLGGYDPYSSSKACMEIMTKSFKNSFFNISQYKQSHQVLIATARAGNVIGGGDWSDDRLIPDIVKATAENKVTSIRNPFATRPWQHVLEPLAGYLSLGMKLYQEEVDKADAWNFGPEAESNINVKKVVALIQQTWSDVKVELNQNNDSIDLHEANLLMLDCSKAKKILKWKPLWNIDTTITETIDWYKEFYLNQNLITDSQIKKYSKLL